MPRAFGVSVIALLFAAVACRWDRPGFDTRSPSVARPPPPLPSADACIPGATPEVIRDFDGDGVAGVWIIECGQEMQTGTDRSNFDDCDDTDPTKSIKGFRDGDGDGYTSTKPECFATLPPGYQPLMGSPDCDDESAERQVEAFLDADGDRYGRPGASYCVKAPGPDGSYPPLFSGTSGDCDDNDPSVHPLVEEHWDDGIDSNCDGNEDPLKCEPFGVTNCGCELLSTTGVPVVPSCAGADLVFVGQVTCHSSCSGSTVFLVGNQGTLPAGAAVDLVTADGKRTRVDGDLGPGKVSRPVVVIGNAKAVHIEATAAQCDTTNDEVVVVDPSDRCVG